MSINVLTKYPIIGATAATTKELMAMMTPVINTEAPFSPACIYTITLGFIMHAHYIVTDLSWKEYSY